MSEALLMPEIQYRDWEVTNEAECYEPRSWEIGNCPNCGEPVLREERFSRLSVSYYWPCQDCGYTHHGTEIPALD